MMQVVVPYRPGGLFARTYDAAKAWEGGARFVQLRNHDEQADTSRYNPTYSELLADLWEQGDGFIMLEQDVVPYEDSLADIAYCREPWCGFAFPNGGGFTKAGSNLGCTKLSASLIDATAGFGAAERKQQAWDRCDARLSTWAYGRAKLRPHRHYPDVEHRCTYRSSRPAMFGSKGRNHWLGNEYIDLDEHGEPVGPREPYKPLQRPEGAIPASTYGDEQESSLGWMRDLAASPEVGLGPAAVGAYADVADAVDDLNHLTRALSPDFGDYGLVGDLNSAKNMIPKLTGRPSTAGAGAYEEIRRLRGNRPPM